MRIQTNLHGRLRNTQLPLSHGLMPLFEAVVNSIESIDEFNGAQKTARIIIEIFRNTQSSLDLDSEAVSQEKIIGFKVTDTGVGFNDENMKSFETLDSEHKVEKGGRGVGRLLWLKAFNKVEISSIFEDVNGYKSRNFIFDGSEGVSDPIEREVVGEEVKTTVYLKGFIEKYQKTTRVRSQLLLKSADKDSLNNKRL